MITTTQRPTPMTDQIEASLAKSSNVRRYYAALAQMRLMEVERDEAREALEAMREAIKGALVEMQYAEARFAGWALRLAPNDPDTDSVLHKTGEAIRKLQPYLKTKGILP